MARRIPLVNQINQVKFISKLCFAVQNNFTLSNIDTALAQFGGQPDSIFFSFNQIKFISKYQTTRSICRFSLPLRRRMPSTFCGAYFSRQRSTGGRCSRSRLLSCSATNRPLTFCKVSSLHRRSHLHPAIFHAFCVHLIFSSHAHFSYGHFHLAHFALTHFYIAYFSLALFSRAHSYFAHLYSVHFYIANLYMGHFYIANLYIAHFSVANISLSNLSFADFPRVHSQMFPSVLFLPFH